MSDWRDDRDDTDDVARILGWAALVVLAVSVLCLCVGLR